jgi:hypothetical protein
MPTLEQLQQRWTQLAEQISRLHPMRAGSVCAQVLKTKSKRGENEQRRGPYTIYTRKVKGKTITRSLKGAQEAALYQSQIENFRRFQQLTGEMAEIGWQMADLEAAACPKGGKKNSRR